MQRIQTSQRKSKMGDKKIKIFAITKLKLNKYK